MIGDGSCVLVGKDRWSWGGLDILPVFGEAFSAAGVEAIAFACYETSPHLPQILQGGTGGEAVAPHRRSLLRETSRRGKVISFLVRIPLVAVALPRKRPTLVVCCVVFLKDEISHQTLLPQKDLLVIASLIPQLLEGSLLGTSALCSLDKLHIRLIALNDDSLVCHMSQSILSTTFSA